MYKVNKVGIGIGKKSDFMAVKTSNQTPGPDHYESNVKTSISYQSQRRNPSTSHGFYNTHDKYDKICYKGME